MKLRSRLDVFSTALLSALGATQLVACGGTAVTASPAEAGRGSAGSGSAGAASAGGTSAGGASAGGAGQGGAPTAGAAGSAGAGANKFPCMNPKDLGNGLIQCEGFSHRPAAVTCVSKVPRPEPVMNPSMLGECKADADCTSKPYGWCSSGVQVEAAYCSYGCVKDSDCASDQLCECAEPVGRCVRADCKTDAECEPGFLCKAYDSSGGCGITNYTCQTPADTCGSDLSCGGGGDLQGRCRYDVQAQRFQCVDGSCAIGRPFLIEGTERLAPKATRTDWTELTQLSKPVHLEDALRTRLTEKWTRIALMEHASIAAFARFSLQLMSLGAPAELIECATRAMADETKHAKACFAIASHYAGELLGPGRLAIERSLDESSLTEIVLNTIREGCVGETVAAIEAREAAEHAEDPALRALLLAISEDETRHAELAYRFVQWALTLGGSELDLTVQREFSALAVEARHTLHKPNGADNDLLRHGIVSEPMREAIRAQALTKVILPCARALSGARGQQHLELAADRQHVRVLA